MRFLIIFFFCQYLYSAETTITILHTNDLQSHFLGDGPNNEYTPLQLNDDKTQGGLARLAKKIQERRSCGDDSLLRRY